MKLPVRDVIGWTLFLSFVGLILFIMVTQDDPPRYDPDRLEYEDQLIHQDFLDRARDAGAEAAGAGRYEGR